ncbi:hypothetical protein C8J57DRAFT_1463437 [Mycena rebaudengoi]|nr:hypothetical protein C8J57DRAFT_1463437 [Mycena rebaudengoi]
MVYGAELEHQIARVQFALRQYVARHCPASRLPVELWDMIFAACVPDTPAPSLVDAPLSVSQVCRSWRSTVLSNPRLWSALALTTTRRHTERGSALEAFHRLVQLWLARSAARPLFVSLTQSDALKSTLAAFSPVPLLLTAVLAHAARIHTLELRIPEVFLFPLEAPDLRLPALEHLKIASPWPHLTAPDLLLPLHVAPRLHTLALRDTTAAFPLAHHLTTLTFLPAPHTPPPALWTLDDALALLAAAPALHTLHLAVADAMPLRRALAHAPALRDLALEFRDADALLHTRPHGPHTRRPARLGALFSLLYTPHLRRLALRLPDYSPFPPAHTHPFPANPHHHPHHPLPAWPQAQFLAFLRTAPRLVRLHLARLPLFETEVLAALRCVPRLRELVVEARRGGGAQRSVGDTLVGGMTLGAACAGRGVSCPETDSDDEDEEGEGSGDMACGEGVARGLRRVEFRHCGKRCSEEALVRMIESRGAGCVCAGGADGKAQLGDEAQLGADHPKGTGARHGPLQYVRVHRAAEPSPGLVARVARRGVVLDVRC